LRNLQIIVDVSGKLQKAKGKSESGVFYLLLSPFKAFVESAGLGFDEHLFCCTT